MSNPLIPLKREDDEKGAFTSASETSMNDPDQDESTGLLDRGKRISFVNEYLRPCAGELVGVTIFVYVGCMCFTQDGPVVGIALAHGFCILVLVASLGPIR